jgi:hypothetical protein
VSGSSSNESGPLTRPVARRRRGKRAPDPRGRLARQVGQVDLLGQREHGRKHDEHADKETARSTTVTRPKSRSMRMSETTSTAKPARAVIAEAVTARPVDW